MSTESVSPAFADIETWPTAEAVLGMARAQIDAAKAVESQAKAIAAAAEAAAARLARPGRLIYVGAGTSGRLAVQDGVELVPTFGWDKERLVYLLAGGMEALTAGIEGAEDDSEAAEEAVRAASVSSADVVIGVAASGRTPFVLAAVRGAAESDALTIGIANNPGTPLLAAAEHPILLDTGAEVVAGSTRMKAGTAQKIALNLLSTAIMLRLGHVHRGLMVGMRATNAKLRERAVGIVSRISDAGRPAAEAALARADGDIRLAVLLALGQDEDRARGALAAEGGVLGRAMERLAVGRD